MTIEQLIAIVNRGYRNAMPDDDFVLNSFESGKSEGDTLALFIAREVKDTFDPAATAEDQLREVRRVMLAARGDLDSVICAIQEALTKGCLWKCDDADECAMMRERAVAGTGAPIGICPLHGEHPDNGGPKI